MTTLNDAYKKTNWCYVQGSPVVLFPLQSCLHLAQKIGIDSISSAISRGMKDFDLAQNDSSAAANSGNELKKVFEEVIHNTRLVAYNQIMDLNKKTAYLYFCSYYEGLFIRHR